MVDPGSQESPSIKYAVSPPGVSPLEQQSPLWRRGVIGLAYISLGTLVVAAGIASIYYRLTHITVNNALVNGRAVRVQAPVDGKITNFYARPGARVRSGQVLAQLAPKRRTLASAVTTPSAIPTATPSGGEQPLEVQLTTAQETLQLLEQQLQQLDQQEQTLQSITVGIAAETVNSSDAALSAARSQAQAARDKYDRFAALLQKGAVSQQEVEELRADWLVYQAEVQQAEAEQNIARLNAQALQQQVPNQSNLEDLQGRRLRLQTDIQRQTNQIELLSAELDTASARVSPGGGTVPRSTSGVISLEAPFEGVIYATNHDTGEQVNRPTTLLSLLDCNELWVEVLISTNQAKRIDVNQPVRIQRLDQSETVIGAVDYVTAISKGEITKARAEALLPTVPANLIDQSLARVRVTMPPTQVQEQAHRFCGVGESAKLTFSAQANPGNFLGNLFRF